MLLATFGVLAFALYIGQGALVYYAAAVSGERAAFAWANASADPRTGGYPEGRHDGLYWRLGDDAVFRTLFGIGGPDEAGAAPVSVAYPMGGTPEGLVGRKLARAAAGMPAGLSGRLEYRNRIVWREVRAIAAGPGMPAFLRALRGGASASPAAQADVKALVVEPAEFLRSFELARYYTAKFRERREEAAAYRSLAAEWALRGRNGS